MIKKVLAVVLVLLLCSCSKIVNSEPTPQIEECSSKNNLINSLVENSAIEESRSSIVSNRPQHNINWGDSSDTLKRFDDHDGRKNNYKDYIMTTQLDMNGKISKPLSLSSDMLGSEFLTDFQARDVVVEHFSPPENEAKVILSVTEAGKPYLYIFYENGYLYTEQNGKLYYLGTSTLSFPTQLSLFKITALNNLPSIPDDMPELPVFDPWEYDIAWGGDGGGFLHKTDFNQQDYDIIIIDTDYENPFPPVLVKDEASTAKLLDYLNKTYQKETIDVITGGAGPIIRVYNKDYCYNYLLRGEQIIDYQNMQVYALPDGMFMDIQLIIASELLSLFQDI